MIANAITGNRTDVNIFLYNVYIQAAADYASDITLDYSVYYNNVFKITKSQSLVISVPYDAEVTNITGVSRTYLSNIAGYAFLTNTPYISDFDTDPANSYTITLSSAQAKFGTSITDLSDNWTFTGTKAECNAVFSTIRRAPTKNYTGTIYYTYTQSKNGNLQVTQNATFTFSSAGSMSPTTYTFITNGIYTPTIQEYLYGSMDYLVVGGGGGGGTSVWVNSTTLVGAGGGGGGDVQYFTSQAIASTPYNIVVGTGGNGAPAAIMSGTFAGNSPVPVAFQAKGSSGTSSSFNGVTALGGEGGQGSWHAYNGYAVGPNPIGGASGNGLSGGTALSADNSSPGGGGASAFSAGGNATASAAGAGGTGVGNSITGSVVNYAAGGPGTKTSGTQLTASTTYGSGGQGSIETSTVETAGATGKAGVVIIRVHA
jgi:hypothetical protein